MRWLVIAGIVLTVMLIATQVGNWVEARVLVEAAATQLGTDASVSDARNFAERLVRAVQPKGIVATPEDVTVTLSATQPYELDSELGVARSISISFKGRRRLLLGLYSAPVRAEVKVRGAVRGGDEQPASHWPETAPRLALKPLLRGQSVEAAPVARSEFSWSLDSRDGSMVLVSEPAARGCSLSCGPTGGSPLWTHEGVCEMSTKYLRFVSDDCERVVLIQPVVALDRDWKNTPVAWVYRGSSLEYEVAAVAMITDIELVRRRHGWLRGISDLEGPRPDYSEDGSAVIVGISDGVERRIPLMTR